MTDQNQEDPAENKPEQTGDPMEDLFQEAPDLGKPSSQPEESVETGDNTPEPSDDSTSLKETDAQPLSRPDGQPSDSADEAFAQLSAALLPEAVPFPNEDPDLPDRSNAYISEQMAQSLPKLKLALEDAYDVKLTKSMVVELSIRMAMKDVVVSGENSVLARWAKAQT